MKNAITDRSEEQKKGIFAEKESVLNNAVILHKKNKRLDWSIYKIHHNFSWRKIVWST